MSSVNTEQQATAVILVEDDQYLRNSLVEYLELKGLSVTGVGSAAGFYTAIEQQEFQVAVVDLGLPDASGDQLIEFARKNSDMSLIVITANDELSSRVSCYRSGADLFMGKPVQGQELAAAIISLAERQIDRVTGSGSERGAVSTSTGWRLDAKSWLLTTPENEEIECTVKEYRLLSLLAETPSVPVKRQTLLDELYGRDDQSAQRALDTLVRRIRKKIQTDSAQVPPIKTVYSVGYLFADQIVVNAS